MPPLYKDQWPIGYKDHPKFKLWLVKMTNFWRFLRNFTGYSGVIADFHAFTWHFWWSFCTVKSSFEEIKCESILWFILHIQPLPHCTADSSGLAIWPPWYKDHLAIKTTFALSQRWSLYQGSTVVWFNQNPNPAQNPSNPKSDSHITDTHRVNNQSNFQSNWFDYRILPIKGASPNKGRPYSLEQVNTVETDHNWHSFLNNFQSKTTVGKLRTSAWTC